MEIPRELKIIGSYWFCNTEIEEVTIPKNVAVIEQSAFQRCRNLKTVTFQEGSVLEKIGAHCFEGTAIEKLALPTLPKEIGENAFLVLPSVQNPEVQLPEGV